MWGGKSDNVLIDTNDDNPFAVALNWPEYLILLTKDMSGSDGD